MKTAAQTLVFVAAVVAANALLYVIEHVTDPPQVQATSWGCEAEVLETEPKSTPSDWRPWYDMRTVS